MKYLIYILFSFTYFFIANSNFFLQSNERREHLYETDKGSYHKQGEWLEKYENSGLYYSRAFHETYVNGFTKDISDTFDKEKLQSSDEDYEEGQAQGEANVQRCSIQKVFLEISQN